MPQGRTKAKTEYVPITEYFGRKRRRASFIVLVMVGFVCVVCAITLATPSLHHAMITLPFGSAIWWDISLWKVFVKSNCLLTTPFDQASHLLKSDTFVETCRGFVDSMNGASIWNAAQHACGFIGFAIFNFNGPCLSLSSLAAASTAVISLYASALLIHMFNIGLLALFSKKVATDTVRKTIFALSILCTVMVTASALLYPLVGEPITTATMSFVLPIFPSPEVYGPSTSLSTGYAMLVVCAILHLLLCIMIIRMLKLEYCENSSIQYQYRALYNRRKRLNYDINDDPEMAGLISLHSSIMDSDEIIDPIILNDEIAEREAQHVTRKYIDNVLQNR